MVDFVALRNQILHGEGVDPVEREPSKVEKESFQLSTGIPLFVGASTLAFIGLDRFKLKMLGAAQIPLMMLLGVAPLSYGIGRLTRGISAQEETNRYEKLLDATQAAYSDLEEQEEQQEQAAEQPDQVGMLDPDAHYYFEAAPSADYLDFGSNGIFGDAIGQEITSFEATQDLFAPRVSYEAQTFGW
tara:strand:- start:1217 stop:1777 length:561 start_codon:yes stop_codon:yes gene_type:complete